MEDDTSASNSVDPGTRKFKNAFIHGYYVNCWILDVEVLLDLHD